MKTWKEELKENITTVEELASLLTFSEEEISGMKEVTKYFPMSIPRYYFSLINKDDPADPIRKMSLPAAGGLNREGLLDTSGESENTVMPCLQHKYESTVLILSTNRCAMYCRHCFRRRLVGIPGAEAESHIDDMIRYVREHPGINNVLLSGGDALMNENWKIEEYLEKFSSLPQLDFIRIGSRTPVTFPHRITGDAELQEILGKYQKKKQIYMVTHFNHPAEMTGEACEAVRVLQKLGLIIKNQTVLLKGVNDDPLVLGTLLRKIASWGMVEHYIFQCRPVVGVKNRFQLPIMEGSRIVNAANAMQNGMGKSAQYTMSHHTGKIAILGLNDASEMVFQYRQGKNPSDIGRIFTIRLSETDMWLDQIPPLSGRR